MPAELPGPRVLVTGDETSISLLHAIREQTSGTLPAIAVSGYADDASRQRVLAAGFNGFVPKPLDPMALADEIVRALGAG